jgi:hypothetical protein
VAALPFGRLEADFRMGLIGLILVLLPLLLGLALLVAGGVMGFRALARIRSSWPQLRGVGAAAFGARGGMLLASNIVVLFALFGFWDVPGEVPRLAPLVTALLLIAIDVVDLVWYRRRFLARCRAE